MSSLPLRHISPCVWSGQGLLDRDVAEGSLDSSEKLVSKGRKYLWSKSLKLRLGEEKERKSRDLPVLSKHV